MLSKDRLKQTSEEKLTMLVGRSFHTFITRCVKNEDLTLLVHCETHCFGFVAYCVADCDYGKISMNMTSCYDYDDYYHY